MKNLYAFNIMNNDGSSRAHLYKDEGQDVAEYAVMLFMIILVVVGTVQILGHNGHDLFEKVGTAISGNAPAKGGK